jgi:hypothetical protein
VELRQLEYFVAVGLLPASMVPARRDLTTRPTEPRLTWDVMLVHSSQRRLSAAATAFVALVDEPSPAVKAT